MNGHLPDLGSLNRVAHVMVGPSALVRHLTADGSFDAPLAAGPDGQMRPAIDRAVTVDAEELVAMIREVVHEELAPLMDYFLLEGRPPRG